MSEPLTFALLTGVNPKANPELLSSIHHIFVTRALREQKVVICLQDRVSTDIVEGYWHPDIPAALKFISVEEVERLDVERENYQHVSDQYRPNKEFYHARLNLHPVWLVQMTYVVPRGAFQ